MGFDDSKLYIVPSFSWARNECPPLGKSKRFGYIDVFEEQRTDLKKVFPVRKASVPSSVKYSKIVKWTQTNPNYCKIDKQKRNTYIQKIFGAPKSPGPSSYHINRDMKKCGYKFTGRVQMEEHGQTKYYAEQTPSTHRYKVNVKITQTQNRIVAFSHKCKEDFVKTGPIKPPRVPGVGAYETVKCVEKNIDLKAPR